MKLNMESSNFNMFELQQQRTETDFNQNPYTNIFQPEPVINGPTVDGLSLDFVCLTKSVLGRELEDYAKVQICIN